MRIFIIGSNKELSEEQAVNFSTFCQKVGKELAEYSIKLILCSPFGDSADKHIIDGLQKAESIKLSIELHYPNQKNVEQEWIDTIEKTNIRSTKVRHIKHPIELDIDKGQQFAWLYSQIRALDNCDVIIVIGGRLDGSASLLLRLAEAGEKDIVPIRNFKGLSQHIYYRNYYKLLDVWADDIHLLEEGETPALLIKNILRGPKGGSRLTSINTDPIFFLSYPRIRPNEADFVEMHLRRRGLTVIRDDNDINESVDISNAIQENIYKADVFIALWCREYACSPWCYDELSMALKKKKRDKYAIWLLCLDETRIVHPEARHLIHFRATTRYELEGRVSLLLEKIINK